MGRIPSLKEMSPVAESPTKPQPVSADLMRYEPMKMGLEAAEDDVEYEVVRGESGANEKEGVHSVCRGEGIRCVNECNYYNILGKLCVINWQNSSPFGRGFSRAVSTGLVSRWCVYNESDCM